jgi:hypothetical protein
MTFFEQLSDQLRRTSITTALDLNTKRNDIFRKLVFEECGYDPITSKDGPISRTIGEYVIFLHRKTFEAMYICRFICVGEQSTDTHIQDLGTPCCLFTWAHLFDTHVDSYPLPDAVLSTYEENKSHVVDTQDMNTPKQIMELQHMYELYAAFQKQFQFIAYSPFRPNANKHSIYQLGILSMHATRTITTDATLLDIVTRINAEAVNIRATIDATQDNLNAMITTPCVESERAHKQMMEDTFDDNLTKFCLLLQQEPDEWFRDKLTKNLKLMADNKIPMTAEKAYYGVQELTRRATLRQVVSPPPPKPDFILDDIIPQDLLPSVLTTDEIRQQRRIRRQNQKIKAI